MLRLFYSTSTGNGSGLMSVKIEPVISARMVDDSYVDFDSWRAYRSLWRFGVDDLSAQPIRAPEPEMSPEDRVKEEAEFIRQKKAYLHRNAQHPTGNRKYRMGVRPRFWDGNG